MVNVFLDGIIRYNLGCFYRDNYINPHIFHILTLNAIYFVIDEVDWVKFYFLIDDM